VRNLSSVVSCSCAVSAVFSYHFCMMSTISSGEVMIVPSTVSVCMSLLLCLSLMHVNVSGTILPVLSL